MGKLITVEFRQDTLFAIERDDGVFVAIKPICDALGLAWNKQLERVKRDPILVEGMTMTVIPSIGGAQETVCLRLDLVNGWLFTIDESRVRDEETRQKVLTYKRECYAVLFQHFYGKGQRPDALPADPREEESIAIRRMLVTEARQTFSVQAARELWLKLNLPVTPAMLEPPHPNDLFTYTATRQDDAA